MCDTVDKILKYTTPYATAEELYNNDRDFDATMMNFIVLGEEVGKLSEETKNKATDINWLKIYGLRNIVAHHYFGINADIVWQIIQTDIRDLRIKLSNFINT